MRLLTPLFALAALAAGLPAPAAAQTAAESPNLPSRLRRIVADDMALCRAQGATATVRPTHVQPGDFDGDGRVDYLVDQTGIECPGAASLYCGNSPCPVYALFAADGFREPRHIPGDVFEPTVRAEGAVSVVETLGLDAAGAEVPTRWAFRDGGWRTTPTPSPE